MQVSRVRAFCRLHPRPRRLALATAAALLSCTGAALAAGYTPGFYAGRTGQGKPITLEAAAGLVTNLLSDITDQCSPGTLNDGLYPHPAPITASGRWYRRTPGNQPTVYHGHFSHNGASGTIDDVIDNNKGRRCHGHTTFHVTRSSPLALGSGTVGGRGTDVLVRLRLPYERAGNFAIPYTSAALLVYASNTGCPASYAAADALARSVNALGYTGLIDDSFVATDYETPPYVGAARAYQHGVFTFHVATNTVLPNAAGKSPFSTVCAMLYNGRPASLKPARNVALATTRGRLVPGPGIPNNQP